MNLNNLSPPPHLVVMKHFGYSLVCLLALASCQHKEDDAKPVPAFVPDPFTAILQASTPDPAAAEFIAGDFNGQHLNCTVGGESTYRTATDQGLLIRQNAKRDIQLNISFNYTKLFNASMPDVWPQYVANPVLCQGFGLGLYNIAPDNSVKWLFDGTSFMYGGTYGNAGVKFVVTSVDGNVVEGTFEGNLYLLQAIDSSNASRIVTVKNGKFRIKVDIL